MTPHEFIPDSGNKWRWCAVCDMTRRHPNHQVESSLDESKEGTDG